MRQMRQSAFAMSRAKADNTGSHQAGTIMIWNRMAWTASVFVALSSAAMASAGSYGFVVDVSLSAKAAALLHDRKLAVVVAANYQGDPIPSKEAFAAKLGAGPLGVGEELVTIPGSGGRAVVTGKGLVRKWVGWVKRLDVLVNVSSGGGSGSKNLLDCGIFEDSLAKAQGKPVAISCKLLDEK
jgi:hypothetical protein